MTIVIGVRCKDGIVLASDSQRTEGGFRQDVRKLFRTRHGIAWGSSGSIAIQQELFALMDALDVSAQPSRDTARRALTESVVDAVRTAEPSLEPTHAAHGFHALFAWHSATEQRTFLLRVLGDGRFEFAPRYTAIGGPAAAAKFALRESEHLGYASLPLAPGQMIATKVVDDVIRATSQGVSRPIQVATASVAGAALLDAVEVRGLEDSVDAFRERQREFLIGEEPRDGGRDTGLRP